MLDRAIQFITVARDRYKSYADANRKDTQYNLNDLVLLSTVNLNKHNSNRKLYPKFLGPFKITQVVNDTSYKLDLPDSMKIHKVFHVGLLKTWVPSKMSKPPPPPIEIDGELEYVVENIVDHRDLKTSTNTKKGSNAQAKHQVVMKREYYVKWLGYTSEHNTWEPEAHFSDATEFITDYFETKKLLESRKAKKRLLSSHNMGNPA